MDYIYHLLIILGLYLILGQSFNLVFGLGRLLNLAHVAAYAIGAYTTALLSVELEVSTIRCLLSSMLISALFALLLGAISFRLADVYFAIGTLAFSSVISALLINWKQLTRGVLGIPDIPRPEVFGIELDTSASFLLFVAVLCLFSQVVLYILFRGPFGRSVRALAEAPLSAEALGQDTKFLKSCCFFVASAFAGLSGSIFAYYMNYIDPSSFSIQEMIFILSLVVVGAPGSFWKQYLAAVFLVVLLPEGLRFIPLPPGVLGPLRQMIHGTILFLVLYRYRERIFPVQRTI